MNLNLPEYRATQRTTNMVIGLVELMTRAAIILFVVSSVSLGDMFAYYSANMSPETKLTTKHIIIMYLGNCGNTYNSQ
jgi:hypothetical protein